MSGMATGSWLQLAGKTMHDSRCSMACWRGAWRLAGQTLVMGQHSIPATMDLMHGSTQVITLSSHVGSSL